MPTGAIVPPALLVTYSNGVTTYTATGCAVASSTLITCLTAPGIGSGFTWSLAYASAPTAFFMAQVPLMSGYASPTVSAVNGTRTSLSTSGGQQLLFVGSNFGPPGTPVSITYGANGLEFPCTYVANAADAHTVARCTTAAGVGANLPWALKVGGQTVSSTGSTLLSYVPPVLTNVTALTAGMVLTQMEAGGSQQVTISGLNFGPAGTLADARYGIVVKYGTAAGTLLTFASCAQSASAPQTTLTCYTVPGVGTGHAVSIVVGAVPALAAAPAAPPQIHVQVPSAVTHLPVLKPGIGQVRVGGAHGGRAQGRGGRRGRARRRGAHCGRARGRGRCRMRQGLWPHHSSELQQ
jgi:hypothetical protein